MIVEIIMEVIAGIGEILMTSGKVPLVIRLLIALLFTVPITVLCVLVAIKADSIALKIFLFMVSAVIALGGFKLIRKVLSVRK